MIYVNSLSVGTRLLPLSFQIEKGDVLHVIGPNGSGKSTLLSAISGLLPFKGNVELDGEDIQSLTLEQLALARAYLTQQERPAFSMSVIQFLSLSVPVGHTLNDLGKSLDELLEQLNISDKLSRETHTLSGGEWQRVRLAAMCIQIMPEWNRYGKLLILDEPAAPLDIGQEALLYELIQQISELGITVVMANHDLNRTLQYASKVLLLDNGTLKGFGNTDDVMQPELLAKTYQTSIRRVDIDGHPHLIFR
ncbi:putative vitamin B12 ABC transporterATP-binding protein BtuD [Vibrio nigripulchritudo ATCC 27043]|uniref:vitamin B12 ABC transporter ATP-binding protein BtuD n=1 Tax=Vibrio nigripulchritudo TaxID=28173 RepID=UPI00021C2D6E|nr:vitamin B12 ABC transporter ATP-binding protein BtuD [Vibrio nigripulchritudo]EGU60340.1 putative vitamin B12 ABC transporterATP-binding protein BtuD [Vibrio nigripulchritudo ATCC 27043]